MKHLKSLITLALACLLAVPAFAMPMAGDAGRAGMFGQLNLTDEEMADMTLAELKEMAEDAKTNATDRPFFMGEIGLLATDLTTEDVEGMTLAEIEELKESLMEELEGMTLAEIEELKEERKTEMEEMTLAELKEQREILSLLGVGGGHKNQPGMAGPNGCNIMGGQAPQGNQPGMTGAGAQQQGMGPGCMNAQGFDTKGPEL